MKNRSLQVGQEINKIVAECLTSHSRNPIFQAVSITEVKVSNDLGHAKIYFTHWQTDCTSSEITQQLNHAVPWLKQQIGKQLRLRRIPTLNFVEDPIPAQTSEIDRLLREIQ